MFDFFPQTRILLCDQEELAEHRNIDKTLDSILGVTSGKDVVLIAHDRNSSETIESLSFLLPFLPYEMAQETEITYRSHSSMAVFLFEENYVFLHVKIDGW